MRLGIRKVGLAASVAFAALLVALVVLPSLASGVGGETLVTGKVTGSGGVPLEGIKVCLDPTDPDGIGFCTETDAAVNGKELS